MAAAESERGWTWILSLLDWVRLRGLMTYFFRLSPWQQVRCKEENTAHLTNMDERNCGHRSKREDQDDRDLPQHSRIHKMHQTPWKGMVESA